MAIAILLLVLTVFAGYATLGVLGLAKGALTTGLTPSAGLATLAVFATWCGLVRLPPPIAGLVVLGYSLLGVGLLVADREALRQIAEVYVGQHRYSALFLAAALIVPIVGVSFSLGGLQAPLSPHDGAFHVETSDAFRRGIASSQEWYPPGLAALFGAVLQITPWVDTAAGAAGLGLGLSLVAPLAVFGLGIAVWRDLLAGAAAAALGALTYIFPYYPQAWSGWPQLMGLVLVIGMWTISTEYVARPSWRIAAFAGLLVGAIVISHGTELYTTAIILALLALARWRQLPWRHIPQAISVATVVAVLCAAPYLPALFHWAGSGGAYQVGLEDGAALASGAKTTTSGELLSVFTLDALGVDLPVRVVLLAAGVVWAFRRSTARMLVTVAATFAGLAVIASFLLGAPPMRFVYAATYPWSLPFRHITVAAVPLAVLAGGGCVMVGRAWQSALARLRGSLRRRIERLGRLLVFTWLLLGAWALVLLLSVLPPLLSSFAEDDAAAMAWLRSHAAPDDVVANDTFADAGIWAPYKAGVRIVEYRSSSDTRATPAEHEFLLRNIANLADNAEAAAIACKLNVKYVYFGAKQTKWQLRLFPPLDELRLSPGLEEVFSQGNAVVLRVRDCARVPS